MDKALEMGKSSATGSFHLLIGVAGSTIIMAIGTLIIAGLLDPADVGLYGMAMIPSSIISFFRDWGVNSAITQQIASLRASGKESEIHDVIISGIIFEIISGVILSVVCFALAWPLAMILSPANAPRLSVYISVMSLSIFAGAVLAAAGGIFIGFERMKLNSLTAILQSVVKTAFGPLLIVIGFGVLGAVYATMASFLSGAVIAGFIVYFYLFRPIRKSKVGKFDIKKTLKPMLEYGLPLTVSSIMIGVLPQVIGFVMAVYAGIGDLAAGYPQGWMMGNYYAATYFSVLLTFISLPIATALFPVFAKLKPDKEPEIVKQTFASSVKYTAVLLVPATMVIITLATPLVNTLFPYDGIKGIIPSLFVVNAAPKFPYAPLFLALSCLVNLFVLVGNVSISTFQTGIGKTRQIMNQSLLSLIIGLPIGYLLVVYFASVGGASLAVVGGIIGTIIATAPNVVWGLIWLWKNYRVKVDFLASAKILAASILASGAAYLFIGFLSLPNWVLLVAGFVVFLVVYMVLAPVLGAVNRMDIDNFRVMFSGLGVVSKVLNVPLLFMRKMCRGNTPKNTVTSDA
jgi:O-antigen/teichoic acid export membrane protein